MPSMVCVLFTCCDQKTGSLLASEANLMNAKIMQNGVRMHHLCKSAESNSKAIERHFHGPPWLQS